MSATDTVQQNGETVETPFFPVKSSLNLSPYDVISSDSWRRKSVPAGICQFRLMSFCSMAAYENFRFRSPWIGESSLCYCYSWPACTREDLHIQEAMSIPQLDRDSHKG